MNDVDGLSRNESLRDVQRQPEKTQSAKRSICQNLAHGVTVDALLSEPEAVAHRRRNRSLIEDGGYASRLNPGDSDKLPDGTLDVGGWMHELQYYVAIVWMQGREDLFLTTL